MATPATRAAADLTSVTYTMPASASPRLTLLSTARTSTSWLTGLAVTPALASASSAYLPAGTVGAASTRTMSGRARSARPGRTRGAEARWRGLLARSLDRAASSLCDLDDHVRRLHHADHTHSGRERELCGGLRGHEADEAMWSRLHLDDRGDAVLLDPRDYPHEPVPRGLRDDRSIGLASLRL